MDYTFFDIFKNFPEEKHELVSDARITSFRIGKQDCTVELDITFKRPRDIEHTAFIEDFIKNAYGAERVILRPHLTSSEPDSAGVEQAMDMLSGSFPAYRGLISDAEVSIMNGAVAVQLNSGGADLVSGWGRELEKILSGWYGRSVPVRLYNSEAVDSVIVKHETVRQDAIIEAARALPDLDAISNDKKVKKKQNILGRGVRGESIPMSGITLDTGFATVEGEVFSINHREIPKRKATVVSFDMTDYTGSVRVSGFMEDEQAAPIVAAIETGMRLAVNGRISFNKFDGDLVLSPDNISLREPLPTRTDNAEKKRAELHMHTRMSKMDAVTGAADVVLRAGAWGHRAVAITDHGVVHAFPEAMSAADKVNKNRAEGEKLKVIYGVEGYFVNDIARIKSCYGDMSLPLDSEIVAFDIETTGLSSVNDVITEIGAVVIKNGEITDTFNTFVNPGRPISREITKLTGITDEMVADAPGEAEAIGMFLEFVDGRVLAAHNATFDVGFIRTACGRIGRAFDPTFIDTRNMARALLANISRYDLHTVATELKIPAFNHHRASDDAGAVAHILNRFFEILKTGGVRDISRINTYLAEIADPAKTISMSSNHIVILAKDAEGIRSLYEMVSISHLQFYRRNPLIPRSLLDKHREHLIIGSACESGELFKAIVDGRSDKELRDIAEYYDYLEIQPIGNNAFLVREGKAADDEVLREYNRTVIRLGEELGKPVVATCDVHFMEPRDEVYRAILLKGNGFSDADMQPPLFFRTTEEMLAEFSYLGEEKANEIVINNTNKIADMCDFVRPVKDGTYSPEIEGSAEDLKNLVEEKLERLYGENPLPEVRSRVDEELNSITKHHFDVIYMIAQKLVSRSLADGYLVGSRGSVGSSVVAYFSDITEVNALPAHYRCPACKHHEFSDAAMTGPDLPDKDCPQCGHPYEKDGFNIPFATFLGFDGDKKPDIDLNFSGEYQARAHRQTIELFGEGYVFRAGTIGTLAEKTAYGYVKKYVEEKGQVLSKAEENRLVSGLVGVKRSTGQHPGGLIVVPKTNSIYEFTPVQRPADAVDSDIITTHFDYHSIEENLLKLDLLGHDDPTMIRMLFDLTGVDPQTIPLDDKGTMSLFTSTAALGFEGDSIAGGQGTFAVPEFGTKFVREMLQSTKPTTFDELLSISGLSHGTDVWLNNAKDIIDSGIETLSGIIGCRDDIMIYLIGKGLEKKLAFTIMEAVRKGKGLKSEWEDVMKKNNVPQWYLDSCNKIKYMFPKAHAAAYVLMAIRIAYYKVHYPIAFYSAFFTIRAKTFDAELMTNGIEKVKRRIIEINANPAAKPSEKELVTALELVYEFYLRGFDFESIDIYRSDVTKFLVNGNKLLPPFTAIPGIGESVAQIIAAERENGEFLSEEDIALRCPKVSSSIIELLRENGALGSIPVSTQVSLF